MLNYKALEDKNIRKEIRNAIAEQLRKSHKNIVKSETVDENWRLIRQDFDTALAKKIVTIKREFRETALKKNG